MQHASPLKQVHDCFMLQVIVFERGDLVFVFNFHPENTYDGYVLLSYERDLLLVCEWKVSLLIRNSSIPSV